MSAAPSQGSHGPRNVDFQLSLLRRRGIEPDRRWTVLDLGCGKGETVRAYHEAGFDVFGCDFAEELGTDDRLLPIETRPYRLPFDDVRFDLVVSEQVFEHVTNVDETLTELARVSKPAGIGLHVFPSRYRPVECHVHVPFAGVVRSGAWLRLWAKAGIRNRFQRHKGLDAAATAEDNRRFLSAHTNYLPKRELRRAFERHFADVKFVECEMLSVTRGRARVVRPIAPLAAPIYSAMHMRAVLTAGTARNGRPPTAGAHVQK